MAQHKHLTKTKALCLITSTWVTQNSLHGKYIWTHHRDTKRDGEGGKKEPVGEQGVTEGFREALDIPAPLFPTLWPNSGIDFHCRKEKSA